MHSGKEGRRRDKGEEKEACGWVGGLDKEWPGLGLG